MRRVKRGKSRIRLANVIRYYVGKEKGDSSIQIEWLKGLQGKNVECLKSELFTFAVTRSIEEMTLMAFSREEQTTNGVNTECC